MKKYTFLVLLCIVFVSCEKLADVTLPPSDTGLSGQWELQSASCFCFFGDDFDFSAHKLDFNSSENVLTIENSDETFFVGTSGTHKFTSENDRIVINSTSEYIYGIKGKTLTMTYVDEPGIADDEITLVYSKI